MAVAVANMHMQLQLRRPQRLQLMDIVVVDVCDGRDDSLDDDGVDNLQIKGWITTKKEKSKWKVSEVSCCWMVFIQIDSHLFL